MILTNKQEQALKIILQKYRNHEKYVTICGYAGVGKSTLVKFAIEALNVNQDRVAYACFCGKAAEVLRKKGNKNAMTLHRLLYDSIPRPGGGFFRKPKVSLDYDIVVVDEISLAPKSMLEILLKQYNPNLEKIIENKENYIELLKETLENNSIEIPDFYELHINSCINRTLTIDGLLDFNTNDAMFIPRLTGSLSNETESEPYKTNLKARLINMSVILVEKDNPNYFNQTKFRIKNSNLIISIPKKIETISIDFNKISSEEIIETNTYTETDIVDNQITIAFNENFIRTDSANRYDIDISYETREDITNQSVESITIPFEKEIEVSFNNIYKKIPGVIITVDEDLKPFSKYSLYFQQDANNNYTGVKISFSGIKRSKSYSDINITVIGVGDQNDNTNQN